MRYLTDRKRAIGRGASGTGTGHHWYMLLSAVGLAIIMPTFIYIFGSAIGSPYQDVHSTFARPIPAVLTALVLVVGLGHFRRGAQTMIEDYMRGTNRKLTIIFLITFTYFLMASGLFALAKIAF